MQNVSQLWKDNQNRTLACESDIEISLKITDPSAYVDAVGENNGEMYFSDTNYIVSDGDKVIHPYATLEPNQWVLDGSREILPDSDYGEVGYVSYAMCDANGLFVANPVVSIKYSKVHTNPLQGITIRWSDFLTEYAKEFTVTVYNGENIIVSKTITDNTNVLSIIDVDIVNYDRVTLEIKKWSMAYRRARICEFFVGVLRVFSKSDVFSYNCSHNIDPLSAELPKTEISFSLDNLDDIYNPYNADGLSKYLMERQEINVLYGYKLSTGIEWIKGAKVYISGWDAKQNGLTADFQARDILEFMTGTYYKGMYNANGTSLYDLAEDVLEDAGLPTNSDGAKKWVIDERLKNIYTVAPLPIDTHANCLQMIANAGECVLYPDRRGKLHIDRSIVSSNEKEPTDYSISHFNSYSKSDLTLSKPLKQVDVPWYSYFVSGEKTDLYQSTISINGTSDVVIVYSTPGENIEVSVTNGTLNSSICYTNACILNITAEGDVDVLVRGNSIETSSIISTTPSGSEGEVVTVGNPLITSQERAVAVGSWAERYMKNRMILSSDWRADPRLDVLDMVVNENDYGSNQEMMTSISYSYNGAFHGSGEGRVI